MGTVPRHKIKLMLRDFWGFRMMRRFMLGRFLDLGMGPRLVGAMGDRIVRLTGLCRMRLMMDHVLVSLAG
jgi:hypothetical protein